MTLVDAQDEDSTLLRGFPPDLEDTALAAAFRYAWRALDRMLRYPVEQRWTLLSFAQDLTEFGDEVCAAIGYELSAVTVHVLGALDGLRQVQPLAHACCAWTETPEAARAMADDLTRWLGEVLWWGEAPALTEAGAVHTGLDRIQWTILALLATTATLTSLPDPQAGLEHYFERRDDRLSHL
jgi:hypothetical protein